MVAVEHHHSSGLRYSPYLMAEPLRQWMGHQPPPASQYHLGAEDFLRLQTPPECLLAPLPPSTADELQTPPKCLLVPLPPSPVAHAFLRLQTLPKCLLVPLPPSPADDFQTPPECLLVPLPPS
ncbi:hypothetical protein EGK_12527, partial [Macaca mulatta]